MPTRRNHRPTRRDRRGIVDPTLVGVFLTAAFGVFAGAFAWLRSDIHRVGTRLDSLEEKLTGKVDGLILALARAGCSRESQVPEPPTQPEADGLGP